MRHLLTMMLCAGLVATVLGALAPVSTTRERIKVGLRTWCEFVGVGLLLAVILYFLPWGA